jgi:hypothetical protein
MLNNFSWHPTFFCHKKPYSVCVLDIEDIEGNFNFACINKRIQVSRSKTGVIKLLQYKKINYIHICSDFTFYVNI